MFHVQNVERLHVTAEPETGSCSSETYDVEQTSFIDVESARFATMLSTQKKKKTASRLVNHDKLKTFISSYSACARAFSGKIDRARNSWQRITPTKHTNIQNESSIKTGKFINWIVLTRRPPMGKARPLRARTEPRNFVWFLLISTKIHFLCASITQCQSHFLSVIFRFFFSFLCPNFVSKSWEIITRRSECVSVEFQWTWNKLKTWELWHRRAWCRCRRRGDAHIIERKSVTSHFTVCCKMNMLYGCCFVWTEKSVKIVFCDLRHEQGRSRCIVVRSGISVRLMPLHPHSCAVSNSSASYKSHCYVLMISLPSFHLIPGSSVIKTEIFDIFVCFVAAAGWQWSYDELRRKHEERKSNR